MSELSEVVERYLAVWNERDPERRRELIQQTWSENAEYRDPLLTADGHDGIDTMVDTVHQRLPGHEFVLRGEIDGHNDRLRFGWELCATDSGKPTITGIDFGVIDDDGRLRSITGFFDVVPEQMQPR